jgi:hypothetical protein
MSIWFGIKIGCDVLLGVATRCAHHDTFLSTSGLPNLDPLLPLAPWSPSIGVGSAPPPLALSEVAIVGSGPPYARSATRASARIDPPLIDAAQTPSLLGR